MRLSSTTSRWLSVQEALNTLTPRDREILLLWDAGLSYPEIAAQTGLAVGAVGTTLARARRRLVDAHDRQQIRKGTMRHIPEDELHAYLDQGLSRTQCVEIESHLADCPSCQATRDGIAALRDRTTALLARLAPPRAFPPAFEMLRRRAAVEASERRRRLSIGAWAASLVAAVGLGWTASHLADAAQNVAVPIATPASCPVAVAPPARTQLTPEPPAQPALSSVGSPASPHAGRAGPAGGPRQPVRARSRWLVSLPPVVPHPRWS